MPTRLDDGSILQLRIVGTLFEQQVMNVFHYQYSEPGGNADYTVPCGRLFSAFVGLGQVYTHWIDCVSQSLTVQKISVQPVYADRLASVDNVPGVVQGTQVGTDMGTNTAATITKRTDRATRWGIGSCHIPGMIAENLDPTTNTWNTLYQGFLQDVANKIPDVLVGFGETFTPILWNIAAPNRITEISTCTVQDTPRVQRRRGLRLGV